LSHTSRQRQEERKKTIREERDERRGRDAWKRRERERQNEGLNGAKP